MSTNGEKTLSEKLAELEKVATRFQSIANLASDLLWDSEPDGSTNWYNQRWLDYTGQSFEETIGWGWINAIHPEDRAGSAKEYGEAVKAGKRLRQEHRIRRYDGEYRWFVVNASPLKDEHGNVIKVYGAAREIHDSKVADLALQKSEEKYRTLFETMDEGFAIIELERDEQGNLRDMRYVQANPAFQTHTGLTDPVGKRVSELMPNLEQSIIDMIQRAADTGKPERAETYKIDLQRWFDVVYTRIGGPGSLQVAALFKDITERRRQEEQVKKELQDTKLLQQISNHLIDEADPEVFYDVLLESAMKLMSADFASIQLLHPRGQELLLLAYKNFHPDSAKHWQLVGARSVSTCGQALTTGERVIVTDLEHPPFEIAGADYNAYKLSGINAVQSTPLVSRLGTHVGMMSTHWRKPHTPSERELGLFDIVARQVADLFERDRAAAALRASEDKYRTKLEQDVSSRTAELNASKELLQATMNASTDIVQVFKAVRNKKGEIIDFKYLLTNHAAEKWMPNAIGKNLLELQPGVVATGIFDALKQVVETGISNQGERHYAYQQFDGWFYQSAVKLGDGVATTTTDISVRKKAEAEILRLKDEIAQRAEEKYRTLFHNIDEGFCIIEMIYNAAGEPVNWRFLEVNPAFEKNNGLVNATGATILELTPDIEPKWFEIYGKVAQTGQPLRLEEDSDALHRSFSLYAFPIGQPGENKVAVIFTDISERKRREQELREFNERLEREVADRTRELHQNYSLVQTIYDTTLIGLSVIAPVRDADGRITDFRVIAANKKIEQISGRANLSGLLYSQLYPGAKNTELFNVMVNTMETGNAGHIEHNYTYGGVDIWYSTMFVKGEDFLVSTDIDVTEKKRLEDNSMRALVLLQQSEQIAKTGSWVYDLLSDDLTWSDGMYRLFNLEKGTRVQPQTYLQYATNDSRKTAKRIVSEIKKGDAEFEESLKIKIDGAVKVLKIKATVISNAGGQPLRVLGVDMDITAAIAAEEQLRRLEAEQQMEIFRVTLRAQEEERKRISESLHNGLGQLLYGIKMSMANLEPTLAVKEEQAYKTAKQYTEHLLTEAIKESRRISHELMPMVLEEFGLKAAVENICYQFINVIKFDCYIELDGIKLDKYFELAVFRTVQELMLNAVKHARAKAARVDITVRDKKILVRVEDNGIGMSGANADHPGIGLASIRSKADLLNGSVNIVSAAGKGTIVEVALAIDAYKK